MSAAGDRGEGGAVVIAAGGTGGHIYPAQALARALRARGHAPAFITDRRGETFGGDLADVPCHTVRASGIAGRGWLGVLGGVFDLALGTIQAWRLLRRLAPRLTVGFGGYASVPPLFAAAKQGRATLIHEANAVLGRANRLLAPHVGAIATSFGETQGLSRRVRDLVVETGNPVRPNIVAAREAAYAPLEAGQPLRLLVLGGSLGATVMSRVVAPALCGLSEELRARLSVTQQCRSEDLEAVRAAYDQAGIAAELAPFFDGMPDRLAEAHLVICRAGASTVAEVTVVGRPALLVPYPHATDDHQTANAEALVRAGGGWILPEPGFTTESLTAMIEQFIAAPELLTKAAEKSRALGRPDAAERLADLAEQLINERRVAREAA